PVRVGIPQSFLQAGGDAAAASLIALQERHVSGRGQHIDIAAMESMTHGQPGNLASRVNAAAAGRMAGGMRLGGFDLRFLFPCADGHTCCVVLMGAAFAPFSARTMAWAAEEGLGDAEVHAIDWEQFGYQLIAGDVSPELLPRALDTVTQLLATKTKAELWQAAFDRNVLIAPSQTVQDVVDYEQVGARGFWHDLTLDDGRTARFPGPIAGFSRSPVPPLAAPPRLGADDDAVDLARRPEVIARSGAGTVADDTDEPQPGNEALPLAGLKVLEFSWVIATPSAVRILADYGATVVKVEHADRPDTMRTVNPFVDEEVHPDNSVGYGVYNAGKRSITLDLRHDAAPEVVADLVRWADIVTESFAPGTIDRLGYGYDTLSAHNPGIIMLSSSLLGQTGPHANLAGYGFMAAAIAGFYDATGWPDRDPAGPVGPYTDFLAPRVIVSSLMAAVEHRRRTGEGQHIDLSQIEASLHYLTPAILDATVNGRNFDRRGNDDPDLYPHGVHPAAGDDRWVAIACTDAAWPSLAGLLGRTDLAELAQPARRARRAEIDAAIEAWTRAHTPEAAATELQAAGVAAYPVNDSVAVANDPQLAHRGHHIEVPHNYRGSMWTHGCRTKMSRTPAEVWRGGPCTGEDSYEVLTDYLGYDADRAATLIGEGLLG
ncbi:MAG: CoA transferase, partial [Actinomycetota bacterium]